MDAAKLRAERLRSHRLTAPSPDVATAAARLVATQAQEFWGGRWALAARTSGEPTLADVDAAFDRGEIVRSWTQRGTLHITASADVGWMLALTSARQSAQAAGLQRSWGIDGDELGRAERALVAALRGGNRLTRTECAAVLAGAGSDAAGSRAGHVLWALAVRGVAVFGPVVPRAEGPTRDQYLVAADEWITGAAAPADPLAELFVRYLDGHGPAGPADFARWAGMNLTLARTACEGATGRISEIEEGLFVVAGARPRRRATSDVLALPPFEEYYLPYVDREVLGAPGAAAVIGPAANGAVRPILVADGVAVGAWRHSMAVGKHHLDPVAEVFADCAGLDEASVAAALARFARFIRG